MLTELDWEIDSRGLSHVRYADDCNIYVKSEKAAQRVLNSITQYVEGELKLRELIVIRAEPFVLRTQHFSATRSPKQTVNVLSWRKSR